ncbi:hypothetical protein FGO68_gene12157 [Halteria grandinella]|uniref:Uncharacterized protein n=1 Tax=Halteria grandinella TaxID=5974 RepID=A0A8J8P1B9_HALGN|nr:hypothetical protein FGO68_gene12157 [Halteria grandinella]
MSSAYLSNYYPSILTRYSQVIRRFVNHISILQQELVVKPWVQVAYSKGISRVIPQWLGIEQTVVSKAIIKGPSFIEINRAFHSTNSLGHYTPIIYSLQQSLQKTSNITLAMLIDFLHDIPSLEIQHLINFINLHSDKHFILKHPLSQLANLRNVHQTSDLSAFKVDFILSDSSKQSILQSISLSAPLFALQTDLQQRTLCEIMEQDLKIGQCLTSISHINTEILKDPKLHLGLDIMHEHLTRNVVNNQATFQYHLDQLWYESVTMQQGATTMGYIRSHDYDLLMILALIVTVVTLVGYLLACELVDKCCCARAKRKEKKD